MTDICDRGTGLVTQNLFKEEKLNQKEFIQKSDEILNNMGTEELRDCLHNIARKTHESKREEFFQMLYDSLRQNVQKESDKKLQYKKTIPDDVVNDRLTSFKEVFAKIEDGELAVSARGYEDYSNGYFVSDWTWEYEDNVGIGRTIENAVKFAYDCVNDCRYEEALSVFELIMDTQIFADDEDGGDFFELSLEEMVEEELAEVNLKVLALNVLYSEYQLQPPDKRASELYSYFVYPYFNDIHIEDIFPIGREELKDTDVFLQSWIDFLMQQNGETAARLLREGIMYHKGVDGLAEIARQGYREHPSVYLAALSEYEKVHDYEKMKEIGKEALERLDRDLKICGEVALKIAQASSCVNDREFMKKCWYEAFYSNSTIPNYLRLFVDKEVTEEYKDLAEKRVEKLSISDNHNFQYLSETAKNSISKKEYQCLKFFSGQFIQIKNWCVEQKNPLGWSGSFIELGMDLMLLRLYVGNHLRIACKEIAARVANRIGFSESKNLVFMKDNSVFEVEVVAQKGGEIFWDVFCLWRVNYAIAAEDVKLHVEWLESVIDKRIDGIVGGKYRNKYGDVALLAAALGEVRESLDLKAGKRIVINRYLEKYPRHTAFRSALKGYAD